MKDFSKIAVFAGLVLLVIVVMNVLPGMLWHWGGSFSRVLPWIIFGLLFVWFSSNCSRRCCRRGESEQADSDEEEA